MSFERVGSETVWEGRIGTVRLDRFRYPDGDEAQREVVAHAAGLPEAWITALGRGPG